MIYELILYGYNIYAHLIDIAIVCKKMKEWVS